MTLTSLVAANNAAAAAAGAGKKAAQVQLQAELNTDEEWRKFLLKDGLLVVDVYAEWCGPCLGMVGNLKKIKVELGGDNLHLAIAKSDTIEALKRFRHRSQPTWMFIAGGQLITVIFGADAPRLAKTIEQELKNEELVKKGELVRNKRAPEELTPEEQEVAALREKQLKEKQEKEAAAVEAARLARREKRAVQIETHFLEVCPVLMMPHAQKHVRKVNDALEPSGVMIADKCPMLLTKDMARLLVVEDSQLGDAAAFTSLTERPSLALLLKKVADKEGDVVELAHAALCGDDLEEEGDEPRKKTVAEELTVDGIPGLFVPADRHQRAAALDVLFPKMVLTVLEPPAPPEPPHVALVFGAWQRRAVLNAASAPAVAPRLLKYGFFADGDVNEPKLLVKKLEQYEERPEKDYAETIVLCISVGSADPALETNPEVLPLPESLLDLGPLHVSEDLVKGEEECARFFPPGYTEPERKHKPKAKKKKKKRHEVKSEGSVEGASATEGATEPDPADDGGDVGEGGEAGEGEGADEGDEEDEHADKATSPPPVVEG